MRSVKFIQGIFLFVCILIVSCTSTPGTKETAQIKGLYQCREDTQYSIDFEGQETAIFYMGKDGFPAKFNQDEKLVTVSVSIPVTIFGVSGQDGKVILQIDNDSTLSLKSENLMMVRQGKQLTFEKQ